MRRLARLMALSLAVSTFLPALGFAAEVRVFAAASLKNALEEVAGKWEAQTGNTVVLSFGASSAVARQVEQGAPVDIFIPADLRWMDYLDEAGEIRSDSRINLLGNQLVLVAAKDSEKKIELGPQTDLLSELNGGRLAVGATESVPAGRYAKAALMSLGLWTSIEEHLAEAENVRAALALVSTGEAPLGIVYATDARIDEGVKVVAAFPEGSYPPIIYPAAIVKSSTTDLAGDFMSYMQSEDAAVVFEAAGFSTLSPQLPN